MLCLRSLLLFLLNSSLLHLVTATKLPHAEIAAPALPEQLVPHVAFLLSTTISVQQGSESNGTTLECLRRSYSLLMTTLASPHFQSEVSHRSHSVDSLPTILESTASSPPKNNTPTFRKGDAVDGLCEVSNGTRRWFPGEVVEVHADGFLDIRVSRSASYKLLIAFYSSRMGITVLVKIPSK